MGKILFIVIFAGVIAVALTTGLAARSNPRKLRPSVGIAAFVGVTLAGLLFMSLTQVRQSTYGVVTTFGHIEADTLPEGLHVVSPVSNVHEVFVGVAVARVEKAQAASKDLQSVHTDLTMNYRVDPSRVRALYAMAPSLTYESDYVQPAMFEVFKAVVSRYTAEQLVTERQLVSQDILASLEAKLKPYGFVIQDINITAFAFSEAFDQAIEAKVTASQKAEQAERELQRVKFEADQKIAQAEGEAKAIAIQAQAIKTNGGDEYLRLQAINRWDGKLPTYMSPHSPMPFIGLSADANK
ncbi:prohibitin family protein [Burkholderia sp. FERM BP-3421]|jgi:regulator of protease activity HflC (stomatin/prohibitin superfamily)|uniref:prohibitin family protein n=1 Tax=Burkholderia sp. FERM BP-3421 TaxID=1494466 RepID=UPI00235EEBB7|nr:prohibitin family protein [Burkholderia sp. FERM BP-3421]WDD91154.1 prohibitin family protein [Burkholderia sp. FERM BP-3421]